jgi:uncharacterized DUF497 family protein
LPSSAGATVEPPAACSDAASDTRGLGRVEFEDGHRDYDKWRIARYGVLSGRVVVICYTPRKNGRHVISMRKANKREKARLAPYLEV